MDKVNLRKRYLFFKHVAQWIEHQIPILKVKGSSPFMLKKSFKINFEHFWGWFWFRHLNFLGI